MAKNRQPDRMEAEIQAALANLCAHPQVAAWSGPEWTHQIKNAVRQVVRDHGYNFVPSEESGAWLWDGVAQERDDSGNLVSVPLALESESSGKTEIKKDFEKLLASNAKHRVMVCGAGSFRFAEKQIGRLCAMIAAYRLSSGDRFLLAVWYGRPRTAGRFIFAIRVV